MLFAWRASSSGALTSSSAHSGTVQHLTSNLPISYLSSMSRAELLCPISSKSSVASLPAATMPVWCCSSLARFLLEQAHNECLAGDARSKQHCCYIELELSSLCISTLGNLPVHPAEHLHRTRQ